MLWESVGGSDLDGLRSGQLARVVDTAAASGPTHITVSSTHSSRIHFSKAAAAILS